MEDLIADMNQMEEDDFFTILPIEIILHIMEFCDSKTLLRLSETCTTLRNALYDNPKLMEKLCIAIDFQNINFHFEELEQLLVMHTYSSAQVDNLNTRKMIERFIAVKEKLRNIKKLKLQSCKLTMKQFETIIGIFLPTITTLYLEAIQQDWVGFDSSIDVSDEIQSESLEEISVINCDPAFGLGFKNCRNVKRLSVGCSAKSNYQITCVPFWQTAKFKLQKLEYQNCLTTTDDLFLECLRQQTELSELSCDLNFHLKDRTLNQLMLHPSLQHINVRSSCEKVLACWCCLNPKEPCSLVEMSEIPHQHLEKFRIRNCQFGSSIPTKGFYWVYTPEPPDSIEAFERDVMTFLNKDSDIKGRKHCDIIESVTIGKYNSSGRASFTIELIAALIAKLPNMTRLELWSAPDVNEVKDVIARSGRRFKALNVVPKSGRLSWGYGHDSRPAYSSFYRRAQRN